MKKTYVIRIPSKGFITEKEKKVILNGSITSATTYYNELEAFITLFQYTDYKVAELINIDTLIITTLDLSKEYTSDGELYVSKNQFDRLKDKEFIGNSYLNKTDSDGEYIQCQKRDISSDWLDREYWLRRHSASNFWTGHTRRIQDKMFIFRDRVYLKLYLAKNIKPHETIKIRKNDE